MRLLTHYERGTRQIHACYFWMGVSYPMRAVRLRYSVRRIAPTRPIGGS